MVKEFSFPTTKKGMQSFLGALNYYNRFIQDFAVDAATLYQLKEEDFEPGGDLSAARQSFAMLQQKIGDAPILRHFDRGKDIHVTLFANEWALSSILIQEHDGKIHPVRFCGRVLKDAEMNYHPAEKEVLALLLLLKTCYTQLAGKTIHVYSRFSTLGWVHTSKSLFGRTAQFAVLLSPWYLIVTRVKEKDCAFAQLLQAGLTSFVDLENSLTAVTPHSKGSPTVRLDPQFLYARLPKSHQGFVVSFDGPSKSEKYGGYGSCSWILWRLPEWTIVTAASVYLEATTVNLAEYSGMNRGVQAAIDHGATELVIVGESRLAIQQFLGVIACKKDSLMTQLNHHRKMVGSLKSVKYLHVVREYNAAADSLATEALEMKASATTTSEARLSELASWNRISEVIYEPPAKLRRTNLRHPRHAKLPGSLTGYPTRMAEHRRKNFFFDFVREGGDEFGDLTVPPIQQAKSARKRVRFAD
ncbi:hypothetical protein PHMEG_00030062 [Phytophthora megakarya]|uniref:RNase H type-1 domain-containing protein n=1 Tax=Phytophthora megakarya TaxID=4795 RepID=A0A225V2Q2_9STRA|nr:hypothetical protein PHMEG_00030062 [Phytophthora megakarya]